AVSASSMLRMKRNPLSRGRYLVAPVSSVITGRPNARDAAARSLNQPVRQATSTPLMAVNSASALPMYRRYTRGVHATRCGSTTCQPSRCKRDRSGSSELIFIASSNCVSGTRAGKPRYGSNMTLLDKSGNSPATSTAPLQYHCPIVVNLDTWGRVWACQSIEQDLFRHSDTTHGVELMRTGCRFLIEQTIATGQSMCTQLPLEVLDSGLIGARVICRGQEFEPNRVEFQSMQTQHP